ncbi:hypothetical protein [Candidatus Allofournierella merdavium]|uniref:hypothetical protein n=1 Tax=Candidatus Allofournierella merdavium TaxID=2838593 RepID=UPI00374FA92A
MIGVDLQAYAQANWSGYEKSVSAISQSYNAGHPLIDDDTTMYCFDDICSNLFEEKRKPTSVDGVMFSKKNVEMIEFKSGFKQRITKQNFDEEKAKCPHSKEVCQDYWDLFFKNQKSNINALIASIRDKAVESYITLEKHIFPRCNPSDAHKRLKLIVVIDDNGIDSMEDTLADLAGVSNVSNNPFSSIRQSLQRVKNCSDVNGNAYFYDDIEVMSAKDFKNHLHL